MESLKITYAHFMKIVWWIAALVFFFLTIIFSVPSPVNFEVVLAFNAVCLIATLGVLLILWRRSLGVGKLMILILGAAAIFMSFESLRSLYHVLVLQLP